MLAAGVRNKKEGMQGNQQQGSRNCKTNLQDEAWLSRAPVVGGSVEVSVCASHIYGLLSWYTGS